MARINGDAENQPEPGETGIKFDRSHHCLGNQHRLINKRDANERKKVIDEFWSDLTTDFKNNGPMSAEVRKLADRVSSGECIVGLCWCHPLPCHVDIIAKFVLAIVYGKPLPFSDMANQIQSLPKAKGWSRFPASRKTPPQSLTPDKQKREY